MLNEREMNSLKRGMEEGFKQQGVPLTDRDKWIMDLTIKTTLDTLNKVQTQK